MVRDRPDSALRSASRYALTRIVLACATHFSFPWDLRIQRYSRSNLSSSITDISTTSDLKHDTLRLM